MGMLYTLGTFGNPVTSVIMVIVSPQGLWDHFQMAELHGLQMGGY